MDPVKNTICDSVPDNISGDTPSINSLSDKLLGSIKEATKKHCYDVAKCTTNQYPYTDIYNAHSGHTFLWYDCTIGHDGYDAYGPESDLYDAYFIFLTTSKEYIIESWHREYWFHGEDVSNPYELFDQAKTTDEDIVLDFFSKWKTGDLGSFFDDNRNYSIYDDHN